MFMKLLLYNERIKCLWYQTHINTQYWIVILLLWKAGGHCTDVENWSDSYDDGCESEKYDGDGCTDAWAYAKYAKYGIDASEACCRCGGGIRGI